MVNLLYFSSRWCVPCEQMKPVLDDVMKHYKKTQIKVKQIDVEDNDLIAKKFDVMALPTMIFLKDKEIVGQIVGVTSKAKLKKKIEELL